MKAKEPFEKLLDISMSQLECSRVNDLDGLERLGSERRELMHSIEADAGEEIWEESQGRVREILFKILENDRKLKVTLQDRMNQREEGLAEIQRRGSAEKAYRELS